MTSPSPEPRCRKEGCGLSASDTIHNPEWYGITSPAHGMRCHAFVAPQEPATPRALTPLRCDVCGGAGATLEDEKVRVCRRCNGGGILGFATLPAIEPRVREGVTLHDGGIFDPSGCPRGCHDCKPLARISSPAFASFMCCGETNNAPVPTDRLRFCVKSTHDNGPVDVLVNFDERDAVHASSVLMSGLAALGSVSITARNECNS